MSTVGSAYWITIRSGGAAVDLRARVIGGLVSRVANSDAGWPSRTDLRLTTSEGNPPARPGKQAGTSALAPGRSGKQADEPPPPRERRPAARDLAAEWAPGASRHTGSSTGWWRPARPGGRYCRCRPRTATARRTSRARPSPRGRGCWPHPGHACRRRRSLSFREREAYWIEDWIAARGSREALADQVRFDREWRALRDYADERGVRLLGDVAIYVGPGSVDHRAHPGLFRKGAVAGAPPDAFSDLGQLWGNPLYDWPALRRTGYRWWVERVRRILRLHDAVRLDHFRGFVAYWAVPGGDAGCPPRAVDARTRTAVF